MNDRSQQAIRVLVVALAEGLLGDLLLRQVPHGPNLCLWLATLLLALWWLDRGRSEPRGPGWQLLALAGGATVALLWRDSQLLRLLDGFTILAALALAPWYARGGDLASAGVLDYVAGGLRAVGRGLWSVPEMLGNDIQWKVLPRGRWSAQAGAVGKGLVLAVPALLLFGGLFMAADPVFQKLVTDSISLHFDPSHIILTLLWGYLAAALLGAWRKATPDASAPLPYTVKPWLGQVEMITALALLDALFLAFVIVQFRYLFGGAAHVMATTGLTYADYARRGFFELVAVAALVLPLLLVTHWSVPGDRPVQQRWFRVLAGLLLGLLAIVMLSAVQRMRLYQQEFGLTEQRLYATAFMGWLALLVLWFAATVLRGRRERFAYGALVSGAAVLLALHAINPDALIAQVNLARGAQGHSVDLEYLTTLSADAAPVVLAAADRVPPEALQAAQQRWTADLGWQTWNWGKWQAAKALPNRKD